MWSSTLQQGGLQWRQLKFFTCNTWFSLLTVTSQRKNPPSTILHEEDYGRQVFSTFCKSNAALHFVPDLRVAFPPLFHQSIFPEKE
ncbi:unnamed protein product [Sphagnum troendelagicum]|uniref:Uncharacterized protein n=1 Tax=Sphagnum troendelagicum TaxID=128251 RepID=A0ABP0V0J2_9BRYO